MATKATVYRKFDFDAAHFLPNYQGKCANMHGHRWTIEVGVEGEIDIKTGMVMDFTVLKEKMKPIIETYDHHTVNDYIYLPTAENIARIIFQDLTLSINTDKIKLAIVRVWETPNCCVEVRE